MSLAKVEQYAIAQHFLVSSLQPSERPVRRDSNYLIKVSRLARSELLVHNTILYDLSSWPPRLVHLFGDRDSLCQQYPSLFSNLSFFNPCLAKGPNIVTNAWLALRAEPEATLFAEDTQEAQDETIRCSNAMSYPDAAAYTSPSPSPANFNQDAKIRLMTQVVWVDERDMRQCHERVWGFDYPVNDTTGHEIVQLGQQPRFSQHSVTGVGILGGRLLISAANIMFLQELHGGQFRYFPPPVHRPLVRSNVCNCACVLIPPRYPGVLEEYALVQIGPSSQMFLWEEGVFKKVKIVSDEPSLISSFLTMSQNSSFQELDHERFLTLPSGRTFYVVLTRLVEALWETSNSETPTLRLVSHAAWLPYTLKYIVGMVLRDGQEAVFLPNMYDEPLGCVYHLPPINQQWPNADPACFRIIRATDTAVRYPRNWQSQRVSFSHSCQHFVIWHVAASARAPSHENKSHDVVMHINSNFVPSPPSNFGTAGSAIANIPWATIEALPLTKASEWVDLDSFQKESTFSVFQSICPHEFSDAVWTRKESGSKDDFYCATSRSKYLWFPRLPAYCYYVVAGVGKVPQELQAPDMRVLTSTSDLADFLGATMWFKDGSSVPSGGVLTDFVKQKRTANQLDDVIKNGSRGSMNIEVEGVSKLTDTWGGPLAWIGIIDVKPSVVNYLSSLPDLSVFNSPVERLAWGAPRYKRKAPVEEVKVSPAASPDLKFVRLEWLRGNNYRNRPPLIIYGYVDKVQHLNATHKAVSSEDLARNIFLERDMPEAFHKAMSEQSVDGQERVPLPAKVLADLLTVAVPIEETKGVHCYRRRQPDEFNSYGGLGQSALWVWIMEQQLHDINGTPGKKKSRWFGEEEQVDIPEFPFEGQEQELLDPAALSDHFVAANDIMKLRFSPCLVLRRFTLAEVVNIIPILPSSLPSGPSFVDLLKAKPQGAGFAIGIQEHLRVDPLVAAEVSPDARDLPQALALARIQWIKQFADDAPFVRPAIYRVRGDTLCVGGDEDACLENTMLLDFPLYVCDRLALQDQKRIQLLSELARIGEISRDFHEREPLQDLIDPNLCPRLIEQKTEPWLDATKEEQNSALSLEEEVAGEKPVSMDDDEVAEEEAKVAEGEGDDLDKDVESYLKQQTELRKQYHWIPTEVFVSKEGKVSFQSGIHYSLPRDTNQNLYESLEDTFAAMVPLFRDLGALPSGSEAAPYYQSISEPTGFSKGVAGLVCGYLSVRFLPDAHIQVIVKAQQYLMPKGSSYAGKWHLEGLTEHIQAVGAYYPRVDPGLRGGDIRFRNETVAAHDSENFVSTVEVQTGEGVALVWANTLPHRVRKIENDYEKRLDDEDDEEAEGDTLEGMFDSKEAEEADAKQEDSRIRDLFGEPRQKKTKGAATSADTELLRTFVNFFIVDPQKTLPTLGTCPQHPQDQWKNPEVDGKLFRERVRNVMGKTAAGWGFGGYGNCGLYRAQLVGAGDENSENFHRTDSDQDQNHYADMTWGL